LLQAKKDRPLRRIALDNPFDSLSGPVPLRVLFEVPEIFRKGKKPINFSDETRTPDTLDSPVQIPDISRIQVISG